jgi:HlyD family secretion protein
MPLAEPGVEPVTVPEQLPPEHNHLRKPWLVLIVLALVAVFAAFLWLRKITPTAATLPPTSPPPSPAQNSLRLKGTTQAVRTRSIQAPVLAGDKEGTLTITNLKLAGTSVKQGELLVEFDRQAQLRDFLEKQALNSKLADDVLQEQAKEGAARAKDETEIRVAEGDLAKAELEMQKVELLSRIDAEKGRDTLDEARATFNQLKETFALKRKAAQAAIRILELQRDRARENMEHAQANADLMQVHSPISGIVVLNTIWKQGNIGEVQEGDQVRPGVAFMQVVDPSAMEVQVPVNQQDLLALQNGQQARVHLDAYPDLVCPAQLELIDPMGENGGFSARVRTFTTNWSVKCSDPRMLPGLSAAVDTTAAQAGSGR